ncbi:MAG: hypothetical protein H8E05_01325 [Bacteroidetes bacterium]|nr:hypothetical protein [Bacteroidota bacterium]
MQNKKYEIIERSNGYWIIDNLGVLNGPYKTVEQAAMDVPLNGDLQYPLLFKKTV